MQKLEAEKRDAAAIPTAEKAQLSSAHRSSVPMALSAGTVSARPKSAPDVVAAERVAERREAELRSQARFRVRLAAARSTAQRCCAGNEDAEAADDGAGGLAATIDGDLAVQESSLRSRLKARQV